MATVRTPGIVIVLGGIALGLALVWIAIKTKPVLHVLPPVASGAHVLYTYYAEPKHYLSVHSQEFNNLESCNEARREAGNMIRLPSFATMCVPK